MGDMTCDEVREVSPELALGIADAEMRAGALAHLGRCPGCRRELRRLGDVVEALVGLAPLAEPPAGFESLVLAAVAPKAGAEPVRHPRLRRHQVLQAAAAAGIAIAAGAGGWLAAGTNHPSRPLSGSPGAGAVLAADLVAGKITVGQVVVSAGPSPWMSVALRTSLGADVVSCWIRESTGRVVDIGTFRIPGGYGYWAAPIPHLSTGVGTLELVGPAGHVLATAALPATGQ